MVQLAASGRRVCACGQRTRELPGASCQVGCGMPADGRLTCGPTRSSTCSERAGATCLAPTCSSKRGRVCRFSPLQSKTLHFGEGRRAGNCVTPKPNTRKDNCRPTDGLPAHAQAALGSGGAEAAAGGAEQKAKVGGGGRQCGHRGCRRGGGGGGRAVDGHVAYTRPCGAGGRRGRRRRAQVAGGGRGDEPWRERGRRDAAPAVCDGHTLHATERGDPGRALRTSMLPTVRARGRPSRLATRARR